jgi:hypothetical protein
MKREQIEDKSRAIHRLQKEISANWVQIGKHGDVLCSDGKMLSVRTRELEEELIRNFRSLEDLLYGKAG